MEAALSQTEIRRTLNIPLSGRESGLVVYLPMAEGFGAQTVNRTHQTDFLRFTQNQPHRPKDPIWIDANIWGSDKP